MFKEEKAKSKYVQELKDRKNPVKSKRPWAAAHEAVQHHEETNGLQRSDVAGARAKFKAI